MITPNPLFFKERVEEGDPKTLHPPISPLVFASQQPVSPPFRQGGRKEGLSGSIRIPSPPPSGEDAAEAEAGDGGAGLGPQGQGFFLGL